MNGNGRRRVHRRGRRGCSRPRSPYGTLPLIESPSSFWLRSRSLVQTALGCSAFELGAVTRLELDGLASQLGATFTLASLTGIDEWRHIAHTSKNTQITYDTLLVACGALPLPAIPGALTFRGAADIEVVQHLLEEVTRGDVHSVAFVIPWGAVWSLPAYELALLTATHLQRQSVKDVELTLVTPEVEPLQLFDRPRARPCTRCWRSTK